jgi:hypothetical protein
LNEKQRQRNSLHVQHEGRKYFFTAADTVNLSDAANNASHSFFSYSEGVNDCLHFSNRHKVFFSGKMTECRSLPVMSSERAGGIILCKREVILRSRQKEALCYAELIFRLSMDCQSLGLLTWLN